MKKSMFRRIYIGSLVLLLVGLCAGCVKKEKPAAGLEQSLTEPVRKILRAAQVDLYPGSTLLRDSVSGGEYRSPADEAARRVRYVSVAKALSTADAPMAKIRDYYRKKCPYVVNEKAAPEQSVQLASVSDVTKALAAEVSPIILVEVRQPSLSEPILAAYRAEMALLRNKPEKDLASERRIRQLESLLAQTPMIRLSVREIAPVQAPAQPKNK